MAMEVICREKAPTVARHASSAWTACNLCPVSTWVGTRSSIIPAAAWWKTVSTSTVQAEHPTGRWKFTTPIIQGAYPYEAAQDAYTGGGIKTDAKAGDNAQEVPAFNNIHDNQAVGTVNYGIEFTAGHDNVAANNRVISSGLLADGTRIAAQYVGMTNGDVNGANGNVHDNNMHDNNIGWTCWKVSCSKSGYRNDQSFPASPGDYFTNSVLAAQPITLEIENNEYRIWLNKMASAGVSVGPAF